MELRTGVPSRAVAVRERFSLPLPNGRGSSAVLLIGAHRLMALLASSREDASSAVGWQLLSAGMEGSLVFRPLVAEEEQKADQRAEDDEHDDHEEPEVFIDPVHNACLSGGSQTKKVSIVSIHPRPRCRRKPCRAAQSCCVAGWHNPLACGRGLTSVLQSRWAYCKRLGWEKCGFRTRGRRNTAATRIDNPRATL
jgi:hypothetical protein